MSQLLQVPIQSCSDPEDLSENSDNLLLIIALSRGDLSLADRVGSAETRADSRLRRRDSKLE